MASTPVEVNAPSGLSSPKLELYPHGSDTIANGAGGDTLTEKTNKKGVYSATVTEALTGWHDVVVKDGTSVIAGGHVRLADDTDIKRVEDRPHYLHDSVDSISELSQAQPSATPSLWNAIMLLYMRARNYHKTTSSSYEVYDDAGTQVTKKTLSDDGTSYEETKMVAGS